MSNLINYLNTLDKDAVAREAHKKDPKVAMKEFGLTIQEQEAMMLGSKARVAALADINDEELTYIEITESTYYPAIIAAYGQLTSGAQARVAIA